MPLLFVAAWMIGVVGRDGNKADALPQDRVKAILENMAGSWKRKKTDDHYLLR